MIVIDTNVISELWKIEPNPGVLAWIDAQAIETLYLSAITVAELRYGLATMPDGRRRTLYSVVSRYTPNATLTLFDFPEPNVTSDQRNVTTVPQQQLFVLNSPFMVEMARAFARRLNRAAASDTARLQLGWQLAYGRIPTPDEVTVSMDFLRAPLEAASTDHLSRWDQLCHALRQSGEDAWIQTGVPSFANRRYSPLSNSPRPSLAQNARYSPLSA